MYRRSDKVKLGRKHQHRAAMIENQVRSLFENGSLKTTTPKAKVLKSAVENMLVGSKRVHTDLRRIISDKATRDAVINQLSNVSVRVVKVGFRDGDNAEISKVEIVGYNNPFKMSGDKK